MRGRKPKPSALRKRKENRIEPRPPDALPRCPPHLSAAAKKEWRRLATPLYEMGVLTVADRAALAAYCQAWGRWVEAEEKLAETPTLIRAPSGYVQQSPWLSVANKQLELMGRYMSELGLTPASRTRVAVAPGPETASGPVIVLRTVYENADGSVTERDGATGRLLDPDDGRNRRGVVLDADADKL